MSRIKTVSFDLDGTLVDCNFIDSIWFEGLPNLYAEVRGITLEAAQEYLKGEYDKVGMERLEWYDIKYWFKKYLGGQDWRELFEKMRGRVKLYPEVLEVLGKLKSVGYKLIIVSNSAREFLNLELEETCLAPYFQRVFSSTSDFKEVKKTAEFYGKICEALGVVPSEVAHVGDNWVFDFEAPRRLGITAFYLDRNGKKTGGCIIHSLEELVERLRGI